jgi:fatty acid-binding protein DegV
MGATLSGFLHIKPIVTQIEGSEKLEKFGVARTWHMATDQIIDFMIKRGVSAKHKIYVSHALNQEVANQMINRIKERIASIDIECLKLSPVMITQGGPGCVAIQYILRDDAD